MNDLAKNAFNHIHKCYIYFEKTPFRRLVFSFANIFVMTVIFNSCITYIYEVELSKAFKYKSGLQSQERKIRDYKKLSDLLELCQHSIEVWLEESDEYCKVAESKYVELSKINLGKSYDEEKDNLLNAKSYPLMKIYNDDYIRLLVDDRNSKIEPKLYFGSYASMLGTNLGIITYFALYLLSCIWPLIYYWYRKKRGLIQVIPKYYY